MSKILILIALIGPLLTYANFTASIQPLNTCLGKRSTSPTLNCDNDLALFLGSTSTILKKLVSSVKAESEVTEPRKLIFGLSSALLSSSASSFKDTASGAFRARFDFRNSEGSSAWCASTADTNPYFQASSAHAHEFAKIITKGCTDLTGSWIKTFNIWYTLDGLNWMSYNDNEVLNGNVDTTNNVTITLIPFIARVVRVVPLTFQARCCSKIEFQIYRLFYDPIPYDYKNLIAALATGANAVVSSVLNASITENSLMFEFMSKTGTSFWCSLTNDLNQWVIISTGMPVKWERVSFMKRNLQLQTIQCVTKVKFEYTLDGDLWESYNNGKVSSLGDCKTLAITTIDLIPVTAIAIKIIPVEWFMAICMKVEAFYSSIT